MMRATMRDGFALPGALLAMVVVGALVTGGVFASMSEDRSSASMQYASHAFMAADRGMQDILGTKNRPYFQDSVGPVGRADTIGPVNVTIDGVNARYTLYVQRLSTRLFKVDSEGEVTGGGRYTGSRRRISEFMRITYTSLPMDRAVTSYSPMRTRGKSGINGADTVPAGWDKCYDVGTQAAVAAHTDDPKHIDVKGAGGLSGVPPVKVDATMDSLDFIEYGDMHLDDLKSYAEIVLPTGTYNGMAPSTSGGVCNKGDNMNWGDPYNPAGPCHTYWPIIYSPGDLHLSNGKGQGILIVDGDLEVTGSFEFTGIVFVYGGYKAAGVGNKVAGSLNIYGGGDTADVGVTGSGNTQIRLSSCAIERAHQYNSRFSRPIPLGVRRFVDMSGLGID